MSRDVNPDADKNTLYCSFCGKNQHEVTKLIAGPTVFICNQCVSLCSDILIEENGHTAACSDALQRFASTLEDDKQAMLARDLMNKSFEDLGNISVGELVHSVAVLISQANSVPLEVARLKRELAETSKRIATLMDNRTRIQSQLQELEKQN